MYQNLIDLKSKSPEFINQLISLAIELKNKDARSVQKSPVRGCAGLLFFEPSTRTRFSFEMACVKAGVHPLILDGSTGTSLEKGESLEDTIYNIEAMKPLFFVIRSSDQLNLPEVIKHLRTPVINAGWGIQGHPTQALLDVMTLIEKWGSVKNKKILFLGDVKHSRVVRSHLELAESLGYHIGYCCPADFKPQVNSPFFNQTIYFDQIDRALQWADAVVALRVQKERHTDVVGSEFIDKYRKNFGLNRHSLTLLKNDALILHPGPINYGVELEKEVTKDDRSVILHLVTNGVFIREAVIRKLVLNE